MRKNASGDFLSSRPSNPSMVIDGAALTTAAPPRWRKWILIAVIFLAPWAGVAATPALRANGIKFFTQSTTPGAGSASAPVAYFDTTATAPRLNVDNGTGVYDLRGGVFDVRAYGAKNDGSADASAAFQAAINAAGTGGTVIIPAGNFLLTNTVTVSHDHVQIVGVGVRSTKITFNPTAAKAAFLVDNGGGVDRTYGGSISGLFFTSTDSTHQKFAIDLVDTSGYVLRDIWIDPTNSTTPAWRGAGSVGLRLRGRELTVIDRVRIWTDTPISIESDPYMTNPVNCDHFHLSNSYLLSTPGGGNSLVKIGDGIIVTNFLVDGDNAWLPDKYGVYWNDTGAAALNSYQVEFKGIRFEQFQDAAPYGFYISRGKGLQGLHFHNLYFTARTNDIYIDGGNTSGMSNITFHDVYFAGGTAGFKHLQALNSITDVTFDNVIAVQGPTVDLGNLRLIWSAPQSNSSAPLPTWAYYSTSGTVAHGNVFNGPVYVKPGYGVDTDASGTYSTCGTNCTALHLGNTASTNTLGPVGASGSGLTQTWDDLYFIANAATVGSTLQDTPALRFDPHYYSSGADHSYDIRFQGKADSTTPTTHLGLFFGSELYKWDSSGGFTASHLVGGGSTPSVAVSAAVQLGTGPSAAMVSGSTDTAGTVSVTTGTSPAGVTASTFSAATVTFALTHPTAPHGVVLSPGNGAAAMAATASTGIVCFADQASITTTAWTIKCGTASTASLTGSTAYQFSYVVVE